MRMAFDWENKILDPDFCRWAFGCRSMDAVFLDEMSILRAWNKLHGDELLLEPDGNMFDDLGRMESLWNEYGALGDIDGDST